MSATPLFPPYYRLRELQLHRGDPAEFSFRLGYSPRTLTVSGDVLCILALADGKSTEKEILTEVRTVNPHLSAQDFADTLATLRRDRLLIDPRCLEDGLTREEADRYSRHLLFYSMVGAAPSVLQRRLAMSTVVILGVGGIGTWVSYLLAAAGVGHLHLIDGDVIEASNLTRQLLYGPRDIGRPKVSVAVDRLGALNPNSRYTSDVGRIDSALDTERVLGNRSPDLIIVSADAPSAIADWIDEYSIRSGVPWSGAGYSDARGLVGPLVVPGVTGCRRCVIKDDATIAAPQPLPLIEDINSRFQVPSFGPLNAAVASLQAKEALAFLGGSPSFAASLGTRFILDITEMSLSRETWSHDPLCTRCGGAIALIQ